MNNELCLSYVIRRRSRNSATLVVLFGNASDPCGADNEVLAGRDVRRELNNVTGRNVHTSTVFCAMYRGFGKYALLCDTYWGTPSLQKSTTTTTGKGRSEEGHGGRGEGGIFY